MEYLKNDYNYYNHTHLLSTGQQKQKTACDERLDSHGAKSYDVIYTVTKFEIVTLQQPPTNAVSTFDLHNNAVQGHVGVSKNRMFYI